MTRNFVAFLKRLQNMKCRGVLLVGKVNYKKNLIIQKISERLIVVQVGNAAY